MAETTFVVKGPISLLTWLIALPFRIAAWLIGMVGRLVAAAIGMAIIGFGVLLCLTGIGVILGIPLIVFGTAVVFKCV